MLCFRGILYLDTFSQQLVAGWVLYWRRALNVHHFHAVFCQVLNILGSAHDLRQARSVVVIGTYQADLRLQLVGLLPTGRWNLIQWISRPPRLRNWHEVDAAGFQFLVDLFHIVLDPSLRERLLTVALGLPVNPFLGRRHALNAALLQGLLDTCDILGWRGDTTHAHFVQLSQF